jgi:hypothetical protein
MLFDIADTELPNGIVNRGAQLLLQVGFSMSDWSAEADCKQLAGIVQNAEAKASVKRLSGGVVTSRLGMKCLKVPSFALGEQRIECGSPQTLAPVARTNVEIINERIKATVLHTVSQGEHDVAGEFSTVVDDPGRTLGVVTQERAEALGGPLTIQ